MNALKQVSLALATAGLLTSGVAQAALNDRGGGLLYDDVLNVTWLQDANYAKTSGYDDDGGMNWSAANTWASSLNISRVAGESLTGWRLAANTPVGSDWNYAWSNNGTTDLGYNVTSSHSELGYMYYVNLGLKGYVNPDGTQRGDFGVLGNGTWGGQANVGLVNNLRNGVYWSGAAYVPNPATNAGLFSTDTGGQHYGNRSLEYYAWAVRPGDVAAVPEPETYGMLLAGLGLLGLASRRKQKAA
ncbi:MAG: PEP-CTERM sorting domain-containing protein [Sulfurimicrobium sp.]|nr:PEP-CTERM sorting domain-containing protein [Sulfurimicrobium sp.]